MAYNALIPKPTDRLRVSQGDILGNFAATSQGLATVLQPNSGSVTFPDQGAVPAFPGTQPGLYASTPVLTNVSELYVQKNINGPAQVQIPFTASFLSNTAPATNLTGQDGWSYLPSGILIKWGVSTVLPVGASAYVIPSSASNPAFANLFHVQLTPSSTLAAVTLELSNLVNPNEFRVNVIGVATSAYYFAIGN